MFWSAGTYHTWIHHGTVWLIDWLFDFISISGKPEKAEIAYLAGDLNGMFHIGCVKFTTM